MNVERVATHLIDQLQKPDSAFISIESLGLVRLGYDDPLKSARRQ